MPGGLLLGDEAPNFEANTTIGHIRFHDFLGDSWGILFSHPRDFTPVCTTELGRAAKLAPEFAKRNVKLIALSIDSVEDHFAWSKPNNFSLKESSPKSSHLARNTSVIRPSLKSAGTGAATARPALGPEDDS
ncbi:peroxiredoxin 6, isoform CRA_b [Rattus norvegicus]|uniref:Thioredoxin-dependent peroxide reductase, mitochondrial n=1 Tax=Rattus norvegicus TaxID=10116 RepID=A6ID80_RAT|nr:peroxiredoxin 6, isoform CRA_b [Rattus norvegicus]